MSDQNQNQNQNQKQSGAGPEQREAGPRLARAFARKVSWLYGLPAGAVQLGRTLDTLYDYLRDRHEDDDRAFDAALKSFAGFLEMAEQRQPASAQIRGFLAYCKWSLARMETEEAVAAVREALRDYPTRTMQQAWQDVNFNLSMENEIRRELYGGGPLAEEGGPAPERILKRVHSVDEPANGRTPPRGRLSPVPAPEAE